MKYTGSVTDRSWLEAQGIKWTDTYDNPLERARVYSEEVTMANWEVIICADTTFYNKK